MFCSFSKYFNRLESILFGPHQANSCPSH